MSTLRWLLSLMLIITGLLPGMFARANTPSAGCLALDGRTGTLSTSLTIKLQNTAFNAGETITVTTTLDAGLPGDFRVNDVLHGALVGPRVMPGTLTYTIPVLALYGIEFVFLRNAGGTTYTYTIHCLDSSGQSVSSYLESICPDDGRLNRWHCGFAPVVVYPGSLDIYAVDPDTSAGFLTLRVDDAAIAAVGVPDAVPALVAQADNPFTSQPIMLYRLPTGEFQINTAYADGKPYIITWSPDSPDKLYPQAW